MALPKSKRIATALDMPHIPWHTRIGIVKGNKFAYNIFQKIDILLTKESTERVFGAEPAQPRYKGRHRFLYEKNDILECSRQILGTGNWIFSIETIPF